MRRLTVLGLVAAAALLGGACRQDMHDSPRYRPLRQSSFFGDERSARPLVAGTVARGHLKDDPHRHTGKLASGAFADTFPEPVTFERLRRGQDRYRIYCTPCHDQTGRGNGMIVSRGYRHPPSLHDKRLRDQPVGYLYDVVTNGFGAMPDYAAQIPESDRWAIVAYVRVLQFSQNASLADLPADKRDEFERRLMAAPASPAPAADSHGAHH